MLRHFLVTRVSSVIIARTCSHLSTGVCLSTPVHSVYSVHDARTCVLVTIVCDCGHWS